MADDHHKIATTIPELDRALSFYVLRMDEKLLALSEQVAAAADMNREDIKALQSAISTMVTSAEMDRRLGAVVSAMELKLKSLSDEVERNKPGALLKGFTAVLAAIALCGSVIAMIVSIGESLHTM
jgi:hypothetical protein